MPDLVGFQEIGCHLTFNIEMNFERKARFTAEGHTTKVPLSVACLSIVSHENVRTVFRLATLNGVDKVWL